MQPDQASFLANFFLTALEREHETTRRVIAAVPADQGSYCPHEKCMSAIDLAWHIANADLFFLSGVCGEFQSGESSRPEHVKSSADVLAWFDEEYPKALARVKALTPEQLAAPVNFMGMMTLPAVAYFQLMLMHESHHRGQLSAYLRPMGAKVPGIYGPSGDEPITMPQQASA